MSPLYTLIQTAAIFLLIFGLSYKPLNAQAPACKIQETQIVTLKTPEIGAYTLWDYSGAPGKSQDWFVSGVRYGDSLYAVGRKDKHIILTRLDSRGRNIWQREYPVVGLHTVHSLQPHPKGLMILATQAGQTSGVNTWMGVLSADNGSLILSRTLALNATSAPGEDAVPVDIQPRAQSLGEGYTVLAHVIGRNIAYAKLFTLTSDGDVIGARAYQSGVHNVPSRLVVGAEGQAYVIGQARSQKGQMVGWVMALDSQLGLRWERTYRRGHAAEILAGTVMNGDGDLIVGGRSEALDAREKKAGWLMRLDDMTGQPQWERFYQGSRNYSVSDMLAHGSGISVAINSTPRPGLWESLPSQKRVQNRENDPYVYLISLDNRARLRAGDAYMNGAGASASSLLFGEADTRIILGETHPKKTADSVSWALALPALEPYEVGCAYPVQ